MELTELKGLVKKHDNQLDHMLQLNSETIKKYSYKSLKKTSIQPCGKGFLKLFLYDFCALYGYVYRCKLRTNEPAS